VRTARRTALIPIRIDDDGTSAGPARRIRCARPWPRGRLSKASPWRNRCRRSPAPAPTPPGPVRESLIHVKGCTGHGG